MDKYSLYITKLLFNNKNLYETFQFCFIKNLNYVYKEG